jgi:hypothetical protein
VSVKAAGTLCRFLDSISTMHRFLFSYPAHANNVGYIMCINMFSVSCTHMLRHVE